MRGKVIKWYNINMNIKSPTKRIKPRFTQLVSVPSELKKWAWDAIDNQIMLEVLVYRVMCNSTSYKAVRLAYQLWPDTCIHVINTYDDIFRGCRAAVKEWAKSHELTKTTISTGT